jgi:TolA-binding protein/ketosteroid isomerase-like protein
MKNPDIAALLALFALLAFGLPADADDLQEANALFKQGSYTQAQDKVSAYLSDHPKDAKARFLLGLIYTEQNKQAEAVKTFTGLTEDYPELPEPYNNLAVLYAAQGQYDKARSALEAAIRTHPSYATAHENLGDIYAKLATQAYDKALQLDKNNATAQTKLELIKELFPGSSRAAKAAAKSETFKPAGPNVAVSSPAPQTPATSAPKTHVAAVPDENKPAGNDSEEVLNTVNEWAKAWSRGDPAAYLAFYAQDFKTPNNENREAWEKSRKERISKSKAIRVSVIDAKVALDDASHASVKFKQGYRSTTLKSTSAKTLYLVKSGDKWLIQREQVGH